MLRTIKGWTIAIIFAISLWVIGVVVSCILTEKLIIVSSLEKTVEECVKNNDISAYCISKAMEYEKIKQLNSHESPVLLYNSWKQ